MVPFVFMSDAKKKVNQSGYTLDFIFHSLYHIPHVAIGIHALAVRVRSIIRLIHCLNLLKKTYTYTNDVHKLDLMISLFLDLAET
jgi:hypothetical protein